MAYSNSINANCSQIAEQICATMATIVQEIMQQARHTPYTDHTDNQLKNQAHPKSDRKVFISGYTQDEDCLCVVTNGIWSEYHDNSNCDDVVFAFDNEDSVDLDFKGEESHQSKLQTRQEDDRVIPEVGDPKELLAKIEDPSSLVNQVCVQLAHDKVTSLLYTDYSSPSLSTNTAIGEFGTNEREFSVVDKVFDKSPEPSDYTDALNLKPPDNFDQLVHGGTIAQLDSATINLGPDNALIGQFGVGFCSVLLVVEKVVVSTKSPWSDKQYIWEAAVESNSYVIREETDPEKILRRGTQMTLYLKPDDKYEFSEPVRIQNLVKNYSQFVSFPIYIWQEKSRTVEVEEEEEPTEGEMEFKSVLYNPGMAPMNNEDITNLKTKNICLYVKHVFILDDFDGELFLRYLSFVKGVVDSKDLPLDVSREILQESRIVTMSYRWDETKLLMHGYQTDTKKISANSIFFETMPYRLDESTSYIDYDQLEKRVVPSRPKLIVVGASAYARLCDYEHICKVCDKQKAVLLSDMAHISSLVAAGVIPSPFGYAYVVTTTTHKSLRGSREAMIFFRKRVKEINEQGHKVMYDYEDKLNQAVFAGLTVYEEIGLTVIEAKNCGLPTFITNQESPIEIIINEVSGYYIDPKNVEVNEVYFRGDSVPIAAMMVVNIENRQLIELFKVHVGEQQLGMLQPVTITKQVNHHISFFAFSGGIISLHFLSSNSVFVMGIVQFFMGILTECINSPIRVDIWENSSPLCMLVGTTNFLDPKILNAFKEWNKLASVIFENKHEGCTSVCVIGKCGVLMFLFTRLLGAWALTAFTWAKNLDIISLANTYVQIKGLVWPAVLIEWVAQSASLGIKDSFGPLKALAVASAINGIRAVVLCTFLDYGIAGATWVTMTSQVVAAYLMVAALNKKGYNGFTLFVPLSSELKHIFTLAAPVFIMMMFYSLLVYFVTSMGIQTVAAHQVMTQMNKQVAFPP